MKKHLRVLEEAGLVTTEKVGRTRRCRLEPRGLEGLLAWVDSYRAMLEERFDRPSVFHVTEEREGMLESGMEKGMNETYDRRRDEPLAAPAA